MPFKSGRSSFALKFKRAAGIAVLSFAFGPGAAQASVTPANSSGVALDNVSGTVAYYPASASLLVDTPDSTVSPVLDLTVGQATDTSFENAIFFELTSTKTITSGKQGIVTVLADGSEGLELIPIAGVGGDSGGLVSCTSTGSACQGVTTVSGTDYYHAVRYTSGSIVLLAVYPLDVCNLYYQRTGGTAEGCTSTTVDTDQTSSDTRMKLSFWVTEVDDTSSLPNPANATSSEIDETIYTVYEATAPTAACPSNINDIYFPGDGEIYVDASGFTLSGSPISPAGKVVVVGNDGAAADTSSSFNTANDIVGRVGFGTSERVSGFTNSTDGDLHPYQLGFFVRDSAGVMAAVPACTLSPVYASTIQGFLASNSCFIATAAFQYDGGPVALLRKFRDEILLKNELGQAFVDWYYAWSPAAADWLIEHPAFRLPVLLALVPLQGVAWLLLHPIAFAAFAVLNFLVLAIALARMKRIFPFFKLFLLSLSAVAALRASAQEPSVQPYIDSVKSEMKEPEQAPDGSFIENVRKDLPPQAEGSYIETIRNELETKENATGYSAREAQKLETKETGGAISDFHLGKSELKPRFDGKIHHAFGLRYAATATREISSDVALRSFNDVYGGNYVPDLTFFYEYQPFHSELFGSLGLYGSIGAAYFHGRGRFQMGTIPRPGGGDPFPGESRTDFQFFQFPATVALTYRLNLLYFLRPFVMAGPTAIGFWETRDDEGKNRYGYSKGLTLSGGVSVLLDWLSRSERWDAYAQNRILHSYLTVEYTKLTTISGGVDFSNSGINAGITFEY